MAWWLRMLAKQAWEFEFKSPAAVWKAENGYDRDIVPQELSGQPLLRHLGGWERKPLVVLLWPSSRTWIHLPTHISVWGWGTHIWLRIRDFSFNIFHFVRGLREFPVDEELGKIGLPWPRQSRAVNPMVSIICSGTWKQLCMLHVCRCPRRQKRVSDLLEQMTVVRGLAWMLG